MKIEIFQPLLISELGKRDNQEDSLSPVDEVNTDNRLFVLCDGMGGHENGEVASRLVCDTMLQYIGEHWTGGVFTDDLLRDALGEVFRQIRLYDNGSQRQMGTTMTFLCLHRGGVTMAHIGDSRIYHICTSDKRIMYKSRDHSLVYDLYMAGELKREEMETYPRKNVITRAITPDMERQPKVDIVHASHIQTGDVFYLCSDGMLEKMDDNALVALLSSKCALEEKRRQLVELTSDNDDNHSAWIVQVANVVNEENDKLLPDEEMTSKSNAVLLERSPVIKQKNLWHRFKDLFC